MLKTFFRASATLLVLAMATACGGGDDGGTNPPVNVGGFTVSLSSTTLSVQQGASGSITATIARTGTFSGTVNLSTENVPAGITASFSPSAVATGTTSTTLDVAVAASVAPGAYTFTIRGQAAGINDQRTATVSMTVTARPSIAVALSPTSASVAQGGNTSFTATVNPTNFTGATSVAITGAPAGVTTTVTTSGNAHTVAVAVGAATATGAYTLTATASGTGVTSATATFTLTVTAPPPGVIGLAAAPAALSIQAGGASATSALTITRTNFAGSVTLGAQTGLPAGATVTFNPGPTTSENSSVATFTAGASTTPGTYNVVLQATGTGAATGTVTVALTVTAAPQGSIAIAATPNAVNATAGGAAVTSSIAITRTNFTGDVSFAVTGLPQGAQGSFSPSPTSGNSTTLSLTFGGTVTAGTYPINVTASGTNIAPVTIQVMATIAPAAAGSIALSISQNPLSVQQGASGNTSVVIARTNFTGQVNLALSDVPQNVTATLGSPSTLTNGSTLTFAAASNATPGSYTVTVTGSGTNIPNATTTVTLNVTPAASGNNRTINFSCDAANLPIWFAAQDGSGPWTRVNGVNNAYTFSVGTSGAVAWVTSSGANNFQLNIHYGTAAELGGLGTGCTTPTLKTVTGTVAGLGATDQVLVSLGGASASASFAATNFTLNRVPTGLVDLLASRTPINLSNPLVQAPNKFILQRGLNPADGSSLGTLDFNGANAFDPDSKTLTVVGGQAGETVTAGATFVTANRGFASLGTAVGGGAMSYAAVPSSRTIAGDLHIVSGQAITLQGFTPLFARAVSTVFRDATNTQVTLGSVPGTPTVSNVAGAPYARLRMQLARQADYNNFWTATYSQAGATQRSITISMTEAYLGSASAFDVTIPDFTAVSGWLNTWGPATGTSTVWVSGSFGWVVGGGQTAEGAISRTGLRYGNVTP
ncbi:MAG: hypothetical protein IPK85_21655 [Gemmatimonadetes bacterium]|nr:hypothetical protein [Gemmatimonadota bacterium]